MSQGWAKSVLAISIFWKRRPRKVGWCPYKGTMKASGPAVCRLREKKCSRARASAASHAPVGRAIPLALSHTHSLSTAARVNTYVRTTTMYIHCSEQPTWSPRHPAKTLSKHLPGFIEKQYMNAIGCENAPCKSKQHVKIENLFPPLVGSKLKRDLY